MRRMLRGSVSLWVSALVFAGCTGSPASDDQTNAGGTAATAGGGANNSGGVATSGSNAGGNAGSTPLSSSGASNAGNSDGGMDAGGSNVGGSSNGGAGAGGESSTMGDSGVDDGGVVDLLSVKPSPGCGIEPAQAKGELVLHTIQTSGTKDTNCADMTCGAWSYPRDYYLWLPTDYNKAHTYPLVFEAPGCSGTGLEIFSLSTTNTANDVGVGGTVIRVGLTPPPNAIGHATNPGQGCFDDKEGDDSVDFVFYETLLDKLKTELCFDENRVFFSGQSSGAWLSNEMACKYAGNTEGYAIRGIAVYGGGLPTQPQYTPTCSGKPAAAMWVFETPDVTDAFNAIHYSIAHAMSTNGCSGTNWETAQLENFPIGAGNADSTCRKILGCANDYPLVVCELPSSIQSTHEDVVNPGFAAFIQSLAAAP